MKKRIFTLLFLVGFLLTSIAQISLPKADLLDIKFGSVSGEVKDISLKNFPITNGGTLPAVVYDTNIKQYISAFPQNTSTARYYSVDYRNDDDFKNKIQQSFTLEVYIKAENRKQMSPIGSMELGGFGIQQLEKGATQLFFGKSGSGYHQVGDKNIYGNIKSDYYHIVYTYDGANLKAYYDGVNTSSLSNVGKLRLAPAANAHWIAIGGDVAGSSMQREFIGDIALVRMYSSALSDSNVKDLYTQIEKRKKSTNIDQLNVLLAKSLSEYADKDKVKPYLEEGWNLMNSLSTTEADISAFISKVQKELALVAPKTSKYPRFAVMSDVHVGREGWRNRLPKAIDALKGRNLDAVFVVGDIADNGKKDELRTALDTYSPLLAETQVYYMMGNHDYWNGGSGDSFKSVMGQRLNQFIEIKGYPFITVSIDGYEGQNQIYVYQSTSKNFVEQALKKASEEYPGKPIFLYMHVPLEFTVYGSYPIAPALYARSANTKAMKDICKKYPQVVVFTGHSHMPLVDERSIYQKYFTSVHDGNLAATNIEDGCLTNESHHFSQSLNIAEGCIVSVTENNDVVVDRIDFTMNELIKTPWVIKAPHDGSMFTYTSARNGGAVPFFAPDAKLEISDIKSGSFKITFPQAQDDQGVHHYLIEVLDSNGKRVQKAVIFSQFFLGSRMPQSLSYTIKNLSGVYSDYTVTVTAIDSFYPNNLEHSSNKSKPLAGSVKGSLELTELYLAGSAAPCGWTNTKPEVMTKDPKSGKFIWSGILEKGEFKLLLQKNAWDVSVNPTSTATVIPGVSYDLNITNALSKDYKFNVSRQMSCTISFDPQNWTLEIEEKGMEDRPLYLVGSAAPCGWTNTSPIEMTRQGEDGEHVWTGLLTKGEFKFLLQRNAWDASANPTSTTAIKSGDTYKLNVTNALVGDYKFNVSRDMYCTMVVNTKDWTLKLTEDRDKLPLYLIGDATPNGWVNTKATPMEIESTGVYTWSGYLKSGQLKFITQLGTWNSIMPTKGNETIIPEFKHYVTDNSQVDPRFNLLDAGNYTIRVDLNTYTMYVDKNNADAAIYIIGDATPTGWYNNLAMPLTKIGERQYQWSGVLNAGQFKFITRLRTWDSLVPISSRNEAIVVGGTHQITNEYKGDYRFVLSKKGEYVVTVDLDKRTFVVDNATPSFNNNLLDDANPQYTVIAENNSISVVTEAEFDTVCVWDLNGKQIGMQKNKSGAFTVASNLTNGVYIIELTHKGEKTVHKIMLN